LLQQIFTIIAPVLVMAFIGFVWVRLRMPFDNNTITDIIINIGAPCLLFSTLLIRRPEPAALAEIAAVGFAILAIVGLQFTVGQGVASGHMHPSVLLRNPILWSIAVALTCLMADLTPPEWIMTTTDTIGRVVIPLMLMSLGTSLARLRVVTVTRSLALSLLRLALGFGVAFGLVTALGLEGPVRGVVLIQSSMPTAVFSYLFALRYGGKHEEVGAMVVLSTLAAFLLLPLLMGLVLTG
jgi:predicted permease